MSISVTSLAEVWIEIELQNTMLNAEKSLPLRKCGLKSFDFADVRAGTASLPLRKCGLKYFPPPIPVSISQSLPLRKCGLKCFLKATHC